LKRKTPLGEGTRAAPDDNGERVKNVPDGAAPSKSGARLTTTIDLPAEITVTAAPPDVISQKTILQVTGIPPRAFLQIVRAPGFPVEVMRVGKLRLVERAPFLAWLRSQKGSDASALAANDAPAAVEEETVDDVLASLGCERAPRRAGGKR
jgi:hypothetical protein